MRITKYIIGLGMMAGTVLGLPSCTDLSETVYDQVMSKNYYNTKQDVINAVFRLVLGVLYAFFRSFLGLVCFRICILLVIHTAAAHQCCQKRDTRCFLY